MGEKKGFYFNNRNIEEPLHPQDGGKSPHPEVPGATDERKCRRVLGECRTCQMRTVSPWQCQPRRTVAGKGPPLHPVWILVLAVLVALVLALTVAVAVLSAGRHGEDPAEPVAPVLACPDEWIGYRNVCYYLSRSEGSWEWGQEQCSSHGASLAMPRREWEMEFLWHLKGNMDYWLGLRRRGERLEWVDGSNFSQMFVVHGQGACAYLYDRAVASASCSQSRQYICSRLKR